MFKCTKIFPATIKIVPIPDIEESIYYTPHSQKFYLQIGFPENSQLYGNVIIYQLKLSLDYIKNLDIETKIGGVIFTEHRIFQ